MRWHFYGWLWRWIMAYRQNILLVDCNTNNGVESHNTNFKHSYLKNHRTSLIGMLTVVTEEFLPENYERWEQTTMVLQNWSKEIRIISSKKICLEKVSMTIPPSWIIPPLLLHFSYIHMTDIYTDDTHMMSMKVV